MAFVEDVLPEKLYDHSFDPMITMDMDWAEDEIVHDVLDLLEGRKVQVTWLVTHSSGALDRIRQNPRYEIGIHPNFNSLLAGNKESLGGSREVIDRIIDVVGGASVSRSHSLVQSSRILDQLRQAGVTHDLNTYVPAGSGIELKAWKSLGLIRVPFFWEDDAACMQGEIPEPNISKSLLCNGLRIYNFHPIHIFLNTANLDLYEDTRSLHSRPTLLADKRHSGDGTRTWFLELLDKMEGNPE